MRQDRYETRRMRKHGMALFWLLAVLLLTSTVPGEARGGHGGHGGHRGGHGHHGFGHGHHGFGHGFHHFGHRFHGFIGPRIGVSIGPYWDPYWTPYAYPPVVIAPPPPVSVQPAPPVAVQPPIPPSWYYCDYPQGYYPYVRQCPGGWRPVAPTPP
jgi:hypothetical protein